VLAALNHPNIAGIYGIEDAGEVRALVMEFVEGVTLAQRLTQGPLPLDEAIPIARQIADALEAAHEKGIIHRDLKPANIAFTADGQVKVLDFGLAKALEPEGGSDPSHSPTLTMRGTQAGVILGTAAYMSPEQARGRAADKRTDVWAFGCVLYEMLTAKRAFDGEDVTDTIAAVVRGEPDWNALPGDVPAQIRLLIMRCLVKDRKQRISDIGVARFLMAETIPAPHTPAAVAAIPHPRASRKRLTLATSAGLLVGVALTAIGVWAASRLVPPPPAQPMRFAITLPQPLTLQGVDRDIAISPAGTHIVYRAGSGQPHLVVRAIDQLEAQSLTATTGARQPFFSPDGRWVGFFTNTELKKASVLGGPAITLCRYSGPPRGASWAEDDTITFATNDPNIGLQRVSAGGGEPATLTTPDNAHGEVDHFFPFVLPGGRGVLFTIPAPASQQENAQVAVFDLRTNQSKTLIRGGSDATYVNSGHLIYAAAGTLRAVPFDVERLEVTSDPVPVVEQVATSPVGAANYAVSRGGTLIFVGGTGAVGIQRTLVWVTRQGREEPIKAPPRAYTIARLSPDRTRIALDIRDQEQDIWVWDLARQTLTRLTVDPATDWSPLWTPDSRRILFSSARAGAPNVYWQAADGTGAVERLTNSPLPQFAHSLTPDATRVLLFETGPKTGPDIVSFMLTRPSTGRAEQTQVATGSGSAVSTVKPSAASGAAHARTEALIQTTFIEWLAEISPDGRWLAYATNESGPFEIHVRPFPNVNDGRWPISTGGGSKPVWARNGRELFYLDGTNNLMSVPVQTTGLAFSAGNPVKLLEGRYYVGAPPNRAYDVSPDGQRFLMIKDSATSDQTQNAAPPSLVVVLNWFEELKTRVK
jgi:Tol biopolymer transport system component